MTIGPLPFPFIEYNLKTERKLPITFVTRTQPRKQILLLLSYSEFTSLTHATKRSLEK